MKATTPLIDLPFNTISQHKKKLYHCEVANDVENEKTEIVLKDMDVVNAYDQRFLYNTRACIALETRTRDKRIVSPQA